MLFIDSFQGYKTVNDMGRTWNSTFNKQELVVLADPSLRGSLIEANAVTGVASSFNSTKFPYSVKHVHVGFHFVYLGPAIGQTAGNSGTGRSSFIHLCSEGDSNNQNQVGLAIDFLGRVCPFSGSNVGGAAGGTLLGTGATQLVLGSKTWVELDVVVDSTAGSFELRINGNVELSGSGINTNPASTGMIDLMTQSSGTGWVIQNLIVDDCLNGVTTWYGPQIVTPLALAADTAQADFVPSTGTSHVAIVQPPVTPGTAQLTASAVPAEDLYTLASLPDSPPSITAVQITCTASQIGAGQKAIQPIVKLGTQLSTSGRATKLPSVAFPLPSNLYGDFRATLTTKPGGGAWTVADVNSMLAGMRVVPYLKGFDFRSTSAFTIDPPSCTYVIGDLYPVTRNGATFGWDAAPTTANFHIADATHDARLAGSNQIANGSVRTFQLDLPVAGMYQVRLWIQADTNQKPQIQIFDGSTLLATINTPTTAGVITPNIDVGFDLGAGAYVTIPMSNSGATNTLAVQQQADQSYARWFNFASTTLKVVIGTATGSSSNSGISHLEVMSFAPSITVPANTSDPVPGTQFGTHAYWRLELLASEGFGGIAELQFHATVGGAQEATGGTAIGANTFGGDPGPNDPSKAFDNNAATFWASTTGGSPGTYVGYHFAAPVGVAEISVQARPDAGPNGPTLFNIAYSDDGTNWTNATQLSTPATWTVGGIRTFQLPNAQPNNYVNVAQLVVEVARPVTSAAAASNSPIVFM